MKTIRPVTAWICMLVLSSGNFSAQTHRPTKPVYGQQILFRYRPRSRAVVVKPPSAVSLMIYKNLMEGPEAVEMQKTDSVWTANYSLSDTSVKMLYYAFRIQDDVGRVSTDDGDGQMYDALFYTSDGMPVKGAYAARALSYTGLSDKRDENMEKALSDIQKELNFYPGDLSARSFRYTLMLKQSEYSETIRTLIAADVNSILSAHPKDGTMLQFAASAYRMIGKTDEAERIEKELIQQNPKGEQAAQKDLSDILQVKDPRTRLERLEAFRTRFPQTRVDELALSQIVFAAIEADDVLRMTRTGDQLLQKAATPAGANALAAVAGVFADRKAELDRALAYVLKALSMVQAAAVSPKPSELSDVDWKEQNQRTEARYRDVLGWIHLQKGDLEKARLELNKAVEHTFQVNVFYHLGCLNEKTGNVQDALVHYGKAVAFGGKTAEQAKDALRDLWVKAGRDTVRMKTFLGEQQRWIEGKNREQILSKKINRPAPDFKLEDTSGGYVRLSAQRGNPVVLCFWATWSKSSLLVLEDLQPLATAFGKDVLFITISTDVEKPTLKKLPNNERFFLPVLVANGIEKTYGIQGVPVVYVIDPNGQIRFENKGYRPDFMQVLSMQLKDVFSR